MDNDLNGMLEQFLSQPDSMEKIQSMLSSLGGSPGAAADNTPPPAPSGMPDLAMLQKLMPLVQGLGGKNDSDPQVALLRALRPYMHDGREKRVDEAIEMMRLAKLLPLLKNKP